MCQKELFEAFVSTLLPAATTNELGDRNGDTQQYGFELVDGRAHIMRQDSFGMMESNNLKSLVLIFSNIDIPNATHAANGAS